MGDRLAKKVVLIGWDAADWKMIRPLLARGQMPTLQRFLSQGVQGNLATLEPILSPMLWTSIATGKRPEKHGIHGFMQPDPAGTPGSGRRPIASTSRQCKALWNILTQSGLASNVVGWLASHPAEPIAGACVSNQYPLVTTGLGQPWPMNPGTVHPQRLQAVLADLRVHPGELGQPHLEPFVPRLAEVDQKTDHNLAVLATLLAECASTHAAATWLLDHEPADLCAFFYDAIDHIGHAFMEFHPPRMAHLAPQEFELYQDVMTGCYRYHDMMLARLLELAGEEATVILISDHGFHSDHRRPAHTPRHTTGPAIWHRPYGIIAMRGPGIRQGQTLYGASVLDITPTILALLGLPVGADMDGRVLRQAFEEPPRTQQVLSWDAIGGEAGMHPPGTEQDDQASQAAIQQLVALGYIDPPGEKQAMVADQVRRENKFNLACALIDSGRLSDAANLLDELHAEQPDNGRYTGCLLRCRYRLGEWDTCRQLAGPFMAEHGQTPMGRLLSGALALAQGRAQDALDHLLAGEAIESTSPDIHHLIGMAYLKLQHWPDAERAFRRALEIDGDSARSYDGLAATLLRMNRHEEAAEAALMATGLQPGMFAAHFHLGVALAALGRAADAVTAFEQCILFKPEAAGAHRWLARLWEEQLNNPVRARQHRRLAQQLGDESLARRRMTRAFEGQFTKPGPEPR
ncbi:MAG: alkaline phosphatase family protein [Phycisphaeraceae bacterium]